MTSLMFSSTGASLGDFDELAARDVDEVGRHTSVASLLDSGLGETLTRFDAPPTARIPAVAVASMMIVLTWVLGHNRRDALVFALVRALPWEEPDVANRRDTDPVDGHDDAVDVVEGLSTRLGVPVKSVLVAAGIKRSSFYSWKKPSGPRPRVASQGRLWELAQTVEDLDEYVPSVRAWLLADLARLRLLEKGQFDQLMDLARGADLPGEAAAAAGFAVGSDRDDLLTSEATTVRVRRGRAVAGTLLSASDQRSR